MATAALIPPSVELFYSYAHTDESLCQKLQKHLTALKRSGLIRDWSDRKIDPGSEWNTQIREAMERAGIILLLISADFFASQYIFDVEVPFALERHRSGLATVIPVLLRPVEWRDSPLCKLQVLPSKARAVTLWPDQDEAFSDVAGRLRELLYGRRINQVAPVDPPSDASPSLTQERVLDAAIASSVVLDEPTDLVIMVRLTESAGLKAILQIDRTYSPTSEDVQSRTFELEFPSDPSGKLLPATLELILESPAFDPPVQRNRIRIPAATDSGVSVFMLTPKRTGTLRLNLRALSGEIEVGSRALVTTSLRAAAAPSTLSYGITSLPLKRALDEDSTAAFMPRRDAVLHVPRFPPDFDFPACAMPPKAEDARHRNESDEVAEGTRFMRSSRSPARLWIGVASSAAALALVTTLVTWNVNHRDTGTLSLPSEAPPAEMVILNRQLAAAKRATELAPRDVHAHLAYAELLEKAHLDHQALLEYSAIQSLHPPPEILSLTTQRMVELNRRLSVPKR